MSAANRRLSETTIAYYDRFARAFWDGKRHHDISQNYAALLDAIESEPPYSILDLGYGLAATLPGVVERRHHRS